MVVTFTEYMSGIAVSGYFCKTRPNSYTYKNIHMFGQDRIEAAINELVSVFSVGELVPGNSPTRSPYLASKLTKLKSARDLYKTQVIDRKYNLHLNFGLRAAVISVLEQTKKFENATTVLITLALTEHYSNRLKIIDRHKSSKPPLSAVRADLKRTIFDKFSISHEFFVIEKSSNGNFHLHIVASIVCSDVATLKGCEFKNTRTYENLRSALISSYFVEKFNTAVQIKEDYIKEIYCKTIGQQETELLELELDSLGANSGWKVGKTFKDKKTGQTAILSYKTVCPLPINTGIADYLAKELRDKVFETSRDNFSISAASRFDLKTLVNFQIALNRSK